MPKFRKKPVVVEAVRILHAEMGEGGPIEPLFDVLQSPQWLLDAIHSGVVSLSTKGARDYAVLDIRTLEGVMEAGPGDFIIQGVNGELYPCKPDIFAKTYDPVEDVPQFTGPGFVEPCQQP